MFLERQKNGNCRNRRGIGKVLSCDTWCIQQRCRFEIWFQISFFCFFLYPLARQMQHQKSAHDNSCQRVLPCRVRAQLRVTEAEANKGKQQASELIDGLRSQLQEVTKTQVSGQLVCAISTFSRQMPHCAHVFVDWRQTANKIIVFHNS